MKKENKTIELSLKDKQILFNLSLDARASLSTLSKKTNLSKEVVHYRLKHLEKSGVIEGYYAVINTYKMGKVFYRVYMKTINMTPQKEREFLNFLLQHPKVVWIVECDGSLDFLYVVWARNIDEFEEVYREINNKFSQYIQEKYFSVMTNVYYFKYKYLTGIEDPTFVLTGGKLEYPTLDKLDSQLMKLLSNEGRLALLKIAEKVGAHPKVIKNRIKKLISQKIITCFNVKINHKLIGYTQRKILLKLNDSSEATLRKLITFIKYHPLTIYITLAIGEYDFEFEMMEKNYLDFHNLIKELKSNFPDVIKEYQTVIFHHEPRVGQILY